MKKNFFKIIMTLCASGLFLTGCSKTEYETVPYSSDMLTGTWLFTHHNGDALSSDEMAVESFNAEGVEVYGYPEDGEWKEFSQDYTFKNGVIHYANGSSYKVLYLSESALTNRDNETGEIWTAVRLVADANEDFNITGTWNYPVGEKPELVFNIKDDGTYSVEGETNETGHYHLYKNFLVVCSKSGGHTSSLIVPGMDEYGPLMNLKMVEDDGTLSSVAFSKKLGDYKIADLAGTWIQNVDNGILGVPINMCIDNFEIDGDKCVETFTMRSAQEGGGYQWESFKGNSYIVRGEYLFVDYEDGSKERYRIVHLDDKSYSIKVLSAEGETAAVVGDVYSASKVSSTSPIDKIPGTWTGTISATGMTSLNCTLQVTNTSGNLTYTVTLTEPGAPTLSGKVYLYSFNMSTLAVFEENSPNKWTDICFIDFSADGTKFYLTQWKFSLATDHNTVYDAHAVFSKDPL